MTAPIYEDRYWWSPKRKPDLVISSPTGGPYLLRWWVIPRNPWFNIYLHNMVGPDDVVKHDHPWWNLSIMLKGWYWEDTPKGRFLRRAGMVVFRFAKAMHALTPGPDGAWSLFITGPRFRVWGFDCPKGWVPFNVHRNYRPGVKGDVSTNVSGGCE